MRNLNSMTAETSRVEIRWIIRKFGPSGPKNQDLNRRKMDVKLSKKKKVGKEEQRKGLFKNSVQYNKHGHKQGLQIIQSAWFKSLLASEVGVCVQQTLQGHKYLVGELLDLLINVFWFD